MKLIISNFVPNDIKENETVLSPLLGHNILGDISEYAGDSEFEEIVVENTNYIPLSILADVLTQYVRKLRKGGMITIHGRDLYTIALKILKREYSLGDANAALYGGPSVNGLLSSLVSINDVESHMKSLGLKIKTKRLDDIIFTLEAERV